MIPTFTLMWNHRSINHQAELMEMEHQAIVSNCGGKLSEHNSIYTCGSQNLKEAGAVAYCFSKDKLLSKLKADTLLAIACFSSPTETMEPCFTTVKQQATLSKR